MELPRSRFVSTVRRSVDGIAERPQRFRDALAGCGRQHQRRLLRGALKPRLLLLEVFWRQGVGLVEGDDLTLAGEAVTIGNELVAHGLVRLARMLAGAVDQMQQHAAALDV